jgi:hypothetical protein
MYVCRRFFYKLFYFKVPRYLKYFSELRLLFFLKAAGALIKSFRKPLLSILTIFKSRWKLCKEICEEWSTPVAFENPFI